MEALQLLAETGSAGFQIADCAYDDRIVRGNIQNPLVVIKPWAALYFDGAHNPERRGQFAEACRKCAFVDRAVLRRPWHSLWTRDVE